MQLFVLLISVLFVSFGHAETSEANCQKMGLKAKFGPPRDQGNMGWCYANTAADLLSYHFREELNNKPVSAAYVALKFNYNFWAQNFMEGGFTYLALNEALKSGLCPKTFDDDLMADGTKKTLKEKLKFILDLKDSLDAGNVEEVKKAILASNKAKSVLRTIPVYDLLTLLSLSPKEKVLGNIADYMCADKRHKVIRPAHKHFMTKYTLASRMDLIDEINENLNQMNPVGIGYFADFFDSENARKTEDSRHMSVIVDREYNKNTRMCEYLIRNSWGKRCTGYKNPKIKARCKDGYVLVPEDILHEYIFSVTYLTD